MQRGWIVGGKEAAALGWGQTPAAGLQRAAAGTRHTAKPELSGFQVLLAGTGSEPPPDKPHPRPSACLSE